jgi:catechol 2,3-dioxygenase-like lactoylglutathione lyase family enzyme
MLRHAELVAFAATTNSARAAEFYTGILGLRLRYEDDYVLSLEAGGVELRLQKVEQFTPHPFTALGWRVEDLEKVLTRLAEHGVVAERYPWMTQNDAGIWRAPSGAAVAWFKDPDGNLLSVAQYAAG